MNSKIANIPTSALTIQSLLSSSQVGSTLESWVDFLFELIFKPPKPGSLPQRSY